MALIEIPASDGTAGAWLATADTSSPRPGVLMYPDAFGLRPRIYEMADRIASWGYVVLTPNVFYRSGSVDELAVSGDLSDPGQREAIFAQVGPRMQALTAERALADADAYLAALRARPEVADSAFGVIGYCMGARLAVRTAGAHPDHVAAVGGFHGGGLVTGAPDSPHLSLAGARAEFVFGHADADPSMAPDAVEALGEALADAGLTAANEIYAGASHGYTMADTAAWNEAAAERHFTALQELFARRLRAAGRSPGPAPRGGR